MDDSFYMQLALDAAWKYQGLTFPNPAVGSCVVGPHGEVLGIGAHKKAGEAHAEVLALKAAFITLTKNHDIETIHDAHELHRYLKTHHNNIFTSCHIYVTLEPCAHEGKTPSCATLIADLGLKKVSISHLDMSAAAKGGKKRLQEAGIEVISHLEAEAGKELLSPFIQWSEGSYVVFKWAQRLDGSIDGKHVSSLASRTFVHKMRDVTQLLVIGGNTVRCDRPRLDARLVDGRAPDVLIYSRHNDFDTTIPLFEVKGRKVHISNSLEMIKSYQNVLIEGGPNMIGAVQEYVTHYLSFISPSSGGTISFSNEALNFSVMKMQKNDENIILWMTRKGL